MNGFWCWIRISGSKGDFIIAWARCYLAMFASLDGDYAGALTILNQIIQENPTAGVPRLYRGVLLDVLREWKLALIDYREVLKNNMDSRSCDRDQAALAVWTIRNLREGRSDANEVLRKFFTGRKPDLMNNWHGKLAAFLAGQKADETALIREAEAVRPPSERLSRQACAYYYISVRRFVDGNKSGVMEMMKKAAATNATTELQWYESELRLRILSGKIISPQHAEAGKWHDNLPQPSENALNK